MKILEPADVAIAGGGWTGLLMAKEIATRTGLSVVVLERGPGRKMSEYAAGMDEVDYNIRLRMMQNISEETITHRHSARDKAVPVRQYGSFQPGTGVGGAGEHWGGVSYRYEPDHFTLATYLREKHGAASRLPDNLAVQDWGVTYAELEPHYWRAEQLMGVGGKAGNLRGKLIEGGNIFEAPRAQEYPNPPHKSNYLMNAFEKGARDLGYHPYPVPAATLTRTYRNPDGVTRAGCVYCGFCNRYGCMIGAKAQPSNTLLPVLASRKNFELRTGCHVRRVVHRQGKAEGVTYTNAAGEECLQPASIVVLSSWTLNNVRLLLLSGVGERYDPAAGRGTLGKNLTHQVCVGLQMFFDKPLNGFMGAGGMGVAIGDFEGDERVSPGMLRGGGFRTQSSGDGPIATFGKIPQGEVKSNWGAAWKKAALRSYDHMGSVMFEGDHLAYRHNYMDLDPSYTDKFGDPLLRMTLDWTDHERLQEQFAIGIQMGLAKAMGARTGGLLRGVGKRYSVTYYQSSHVQGGVIMGASPETSVLNPWLQHWRVPNLWVLGGCTFPQNGWGNPTLSALALTYRAADALVDRYLQHPGALA